MVILRHFILYFKRNIYFMISIITLFIAIVFAATMFFVNDISNPPSSTTLGSIYLGAYEKDQYEGIVNAEINSYLDDAVYQISYQNSIYNIDLSLFDFNFELTMSSIVDNQENHAYFSISETNLTDLASQLELNFSSRVSDVIQLDDLVEQITQDMGNMISLKQYQLADYFTTDSDLTSLNESVINQVNNLDVAKIIEIVEQITIEPHSRYSILEHLGALDLTNEQLSIISTGILKVIVKSHMNGFIFHTNPELPMWAATGYNVRVLKVNQYDFSFYNSFEYTYQIDIEQIGLTSLRFTLSGVPFVDVYDVIVEDKVVIPRDTIYYENEDLNEFTPDITIIDTALDTTYLLLLEAGYDGNIYYINRTVTDAFGTITQYKIYEEQYNAQPDIYDRFIIEKEG